MGNACSKIIKPWADGPFPLIQSPRQRDGITDLSKETGAMKLTNEMVSVHNLLIRGLNCIYLQAPNVKDPTDVVDFLIFMRAWHDTLHKHHYHEEKLMFPLLEEMIGIPKFMEGNVEQHHAFTPGIEAFNEYINACQKEKIEFDGHKVREIIDAFADILLGHLRDEIPTIEALNKHNTKIDWGSFNKQLVAMIVNETNKDLEVPIVLTNNDVTYENYVHTDFPPFPWIAMLIFRWVHVPKYAGSWRFSSCDSYGRPKNLDFA